MKMGVNLLSLLMTPTLVGLLTGNELRSFKADTTILRLFYLSFIQSVVTVAIQCWGGGVSVQTGICWTRIQN